MAGYARRHSTAVQARRAFDPVPPLNSFKRDGWVCALRAMDIACFGEPREIVSWRCSKVWLRQRVAERVAAGEPFPKPH